MPSAFVFVVPAGVSLVLALLTAAAYHQARRGYLAVWAAAWAVAVLYYLALIGAVMAGDPAGDVFGMLGPAGTTLGWARAVVFWLGARWLVGKPPSRRLVALLLLGTLLWLGCVLGLLEGQGLAAPVTRMGEATWFLAAAAVLLLGGPRSMVGLLAGTMLLLLGLQGFLASWLVMDLTGTIASGWVSSALALAVGLSVLGRLLEEEREVANARSRELAAANARLAELDRLKSDFVSMVSHELRTPLGLIKGYVGTLLRKDAPLDDETREEFLQVIDEETDRLTELVTNLLDMSRIEAGTLRVDCQPTPLGPLLEDCAARLRAREPARRLDVALPPALPLVLADERRIAQVVENLLTNAVRYSPDAAPIAVRARVVNGSVEVAVADQGPGLTPEQRAQVFEKFFRIDQSDSRRFGGAGLGLAICRGIVEAHRGRIWVENGAGGGSVFAFTLPVQREEP